jgi:predicted RNA-binding protein with PUA-like domain
MLTIEQQHPDVTTDLERVTAYVDPEIKQGLEAWAKQEQRSVSNLAAVILTNAYREFEKQQQRSQEQAEQ